jgi:hypothetical protein
MGHGVADCVPPVHAVKHSEPPPNPISGTIKICIDYDSWLFLQRVCSEILSPVEQRIMALLAIRRPIQETARGWMFAIQKRQI